MVPFSQKKMPFGMPKLNITGLGLSELQKDEPPKPIKNDLETLNPNQAAAASTIDYAGYIDPSGGGTVASK